MKCVTIDNVTKAEHVCNERGVSIMKSIKKEKEMHDARGIY